MSGISGNLINWLAMAPCRLGISGNDDYRPFIISASQRTGSNYLLHLLKSSKRVIGFAELFSPRGPFWTGRAYAPLNHKAALELREQNAAEFLDRCVFRQYPANISAVGFKAHYGQLEKYPSALAQLADLDSLIVLHLRRRNLISVAASRTRALKTGRYLASKDTGEIDATSVVLNTDRLQQFFHAYEANHDWPERNLPRATSVHIVYEDLEKSVPTALAETLTKLGISDSSISPRTVKQNPLGWRAVVENVDEVETVLSETKWAYQLDLPG